MCDGNSEVKNGRSRVIMTAIFIPDFLNFIPGSGPGATDTVQHKPLECNNFFYLSQGGYHANRSSSPQAREDYCQRIEEEKLIYGIFHFAVHYFHEKLTPEVRKSLLISQDTFDPKGTWQNIYDTWGMTDAMIEENLIGFDDGSLLQALRNRGIMTTISSNPAFFTRMKTAVSAVAYFKIA